MHFYQLHIFHGYQLQMLYYLVYRVQMAFHVSGFARRSPTYAYHLLEAVEPLIVCTQSLFFLGLVHLHQISTTR